LQEVDGEEDKECAVPIIVRNGEDAVEAERGIDDLAEDDAAEDFDDRGLNQERYWRMSEGKIAVRHLADGESEGVVEQVAEVPEEADVGVLPEGDGWRWPQRARRRRECRGAASGWDGAGLA
jgi:hypothetical protein